MKTRLAHLNPLPMFGLRAEWPEPEEEYYGDGWCIECGDEFHLDDIGGYNPPCACGYHCRSCHEALEHDMAYDSCDDDDEGPPCEECGGWHIPHFCDTCGGIACSNCQCGSEEAYDVDDGDYIAERVTQRADAPAGPFD